jgi:hypothetical protein
MIALTQFSDGCTEFACDGSQTIAAADAISAISGGRAMSGNMTHSGALMLMHAMSRMAMAHVSRTGAERNRNQQQNAKAKSRGATREGGRATEKQRVFAHGVPKFENTLLRPEHGSNEKGTNARFSTCNNATQAELALYVLQAEM